MHPSWQLVHDNKDLNFYPYDQNSYTPSLCFHFLITLFVLTPLSLLPYVNGLALLFHDVLLQQHVMFFLQEVLYDYNLFRILLDRKSTRLNSSHVSISYAVFCLKKKKKRNKNLYLYPPSIDAPFFFFPAPSITDFYTLSLHDALPI